MYYVKVFLVGRTSHLKRQARDCPTIFEALVSSGQIKGIYGWNTKFAQNNSINITTKYYFVNSYQKNYFLLTILLTEVKLYVHFDVSSI